MNVRPDFAHPPDAYLPGWLVMVNAEGFRFFNEMAPYSVTQPIMLSQPHPIYAIFDADAKRAAQPRSTFNAKNVHIPGADWEDWVKPVIDETAGKGRVVRAGSISDLAAALDMPASQLAGLFAACECTGGVLGEVYMGSGNSLSNCLSFGRIAGRSAAACAVDAGPALGSQ
jgi:hypothetical protein